MALLAAERFEAYGPSHQGALLLLVLGVAVIVWFGRRERGSARAERIGRVLAAAVLAVTDPGLEPPRSVRRSGANPRFAAVADAGSLADEVADHVARLRSELGEGKVAVIGPAGALPGVRAGLARRAGMELGDGDDPLDAPVALLTPTEAKGLEFDAVVLVEPAELAGGSTAGLRGLYVALTRATRFLAVVHSQPLPEPLRPFAATGGAAGTA